MQPEFASAARWRRCGESFSCASLCDSKGIAWRMTVERAPDGWRDSIVWQATDTTVTVGCRRLVGVAAKTDAIAAVRHFRA